MRGASGVDGAGGGERSFLTIAATVYKVKTKVLTKVKTNGVADRRRSSQASQIVADRRRSSQIVAGVADRRRSSQIVAGAADRRRSSQIVADRRRRRDDPRSSRLSLNVVTRSDDCSSGVQSKSLKHSPP
jgi:hypothetical protein